jgi:hypothetical protein
MLNLRCDSFSQGRFRACQLSPNHATSIWLHVYLIHFMYKLFSKLLSPFCALCARAIQVFFKKETVPASLLIKQRNDNLRPSKPN